MLYFYYPDIDLFHNNLLFYRFFNEYSFLDVYSLYIQIHGNKLTKFCTQSKILKIIKGIIYFIKMDKKQSMTYKYLHILFVVTLYWYDLNLFFCIE